MNEIIPGQLKRAIESRLGGSATFIQSVPVDERYDSMPVWRGVVHIFDLTGPKAPRAYAWASPGVNDKTRFYAVLHSGTVTGPTEAVRAAVLVERRGQIADP